MKLKNSIKFNSEFPEQFNWESLDSISLSDLGIKFADRIKSESILIPAQRHCTCGLRLALNKIAEIAEI